MRNKPLEESVAPRPAPARFNATDFAAAHAAWGANCGPGALAAVLGLSLEELRPHLGDFEQKRYMSPSMMWATLRRLGVDWHILGDPRQDGHCQWPHYGLARIQWEGPWTKPGVPARVAYRHTHWVGACDWYADGSNVGIFDINAMGNGTGWSSAADWSAIVVPWVLKQAEPKANGQWHVTHAVEVRGRAAQAAA